MNLPVPLADAIRAKAAAARSNHVARARKLGLRVAYTVADLVDLLARSVGQCCPYCNAIMPLSEIELDHTRPTSRGGRFDHQNTRAICSRCNRLKGQMDGEDYERFRHTLTHMSPVSAEDICRRLLAGGGAFKRRRITHHG